MRELHLFAGIGGGILGGMLLGHRCVGAVEFNPYCRQVLEARQRDGVLESFPILEDVRTFDGNPWRGKVDVICGGFPCQPWSTAGKRLGTADPRHLWPEMARIVSEVRPAYVFAENVSMAAFEQPWRDLRGMGYRVPPALCLGAGHVGAPHRRLRWWMLANANGSGLEGRDGAVVRERASQRAAGHGGALGNPDGVRELQPKGGLKLERGRPGDAGWWGSEPRVGRVAHGVPSRVERLKALGNAQVPQVAAEAFSALMREHYGAEVFA